MDTAAIRATLDAIVDPVDDKTLVEILARCMITQTLLLCDIADELRKLNARPSYEVVPGRFNY